MSPGGKSILCMHSTYTTKDENGKEYVVSAGPTTSKRMETLEADVIEKTGVKLIIGKGLVNNIVFAMHKTDHDLLTYFGVLGH